MTFSAGWAFAELHMDAVRNGLGRLPIKYFMDIETAPVRRDMEEATDLVLSISGGDIAVRIRRRKYWQPDKFAPDLSIRAINRGFKTEIHKLREGFGKWYFYGFSKDDQGELLIWWLLDIDKMRDCNIFEDGRYPTYPNGDGTEGMYIPIKELILNGCVIHEQKAEA